MPSVCHPGSPVPAWSVHRSLYAQDPKARGYHTCCRLRPIWDLLNSSSAPSPDITPPSTCPKCQNSTGTIYVLLDYHISLRKNDPISVGGADQAPCVLRLWANNCLPAPSFRDAYLGSPLSDP